MDSMDDATWKQSIRGVQPLKLPQRQLADEQTHAGTAYAEYIRFGRRLYASAKPAASNLDLIVALRDASTKAESGKVRMLEHMRDHKPQQPDITVVWRDDDVCVGLRSAMESADGLPVLATHVGCHYDGREKVVGDFMAELARLPDGETEAQDLSVPLGQQLPRRTTHAEILAIFNDPSKKPKAPFSLLDVANPWKSQQLPAFVWDTSLYCRYCDLYQRRQPDPVLEEWLLISTEGSCSFWHEDTTGYATVVMSLEGEKDWFFPWHRSEELSRLKYRVAGPRDVVGPTVGVRLKPGNLLFMPPATPHAVYTASRSLFVGRFVYTAGTFHRSVRMLTETVMGRTHLNEPTRRRGLERMIRLILVLHDKRLFSEEQQWKVAFALRHFTVEYAKATKTGKTARKFERFYTAANIVQRHYFAEGNGAGTVPRPSKSLAAQAGEALEGYDIDEDSEENGYDEEDEDDAGDDSSDGEDGDGEDGEDGKSKGSEGSTDSKRVKDSEEDESTQGGEEAGERDTVDGREDGSSSSGYRDV